MRLESLRTRGAHLGKRERELIDRGVQNTGSTHATSGKARDGEPRLAAMQDCIASQVLPAASRGRTHAFDG